MIETRNETKTARRAGARSGGRSQAAARKVVALAGVVGALIEHPPSKAAAAELSPARLIEVIRVGLPVRELEVLQAGLDVPMDRLALKLGMSRATLHRRKAQGRLDAEESDRVVRYARLLGKAVDVMEGRDAARLWLTSPQAGLGGAVPLDYAETEVGAREVDDLLGRIEYGVYS